MYSYRGGGLVRFFAVPVYVCVDGMQERGEVLVLRGAVRRHHLHDRATT